MESLRDVDACLMTGPTNAMHFCGLPSVALRLGMDASGAPCGMILYGADEKRLFSAALCIEQYAGPISWPRESNENAASVDIKKGRRFLRRPCVLYCLNP